MGVAVPRPGSLIFHLMLLVSLQVVGGLPLEATPLARGPRHWGQYWSAVEGAEWAAKTTRVTGRRVSQNGFMGQSRLVGCRNQDFLASVQAGLPRSRSKLLTAWSRGRRRRERTGWRRCDRHGSFRNRT